MKAIFSSREGSDSDWDPVEIPSPSLKLSESSQSVIPVS